MGKIIQPLAHQLVRAQEEIDRLRKLNSELEIKNLALRNRLARYERVDTHEDSQTRQRSQTRSTAQPVKQYQKSTTASRNRGAKDDDSPSHPPRLIVTVQGTRLEYSEGAITKSEGIRLCCLTGRPLYQECTISSVKKKMHSWEIKGKRTRSSWDTETLTAPTPEPKADGWTNGPKSHDTQSEGQARLRVAPELTTLSIQSRLEDRQWLDGPSGHVYISSTTGYRLLCRAFRLAQETFHDAARDHWPSVWESRRLYEGPQEVLFGFSELESCLGRNNYPINGLGIGTSSSEDVYKAALGMVDVRNNVCHFGGRGWSALNTYDDLMKRCQKLAVTVQDEKRSFKIRKIRDLLREEAERTFAEIEELGNFAALPCAKPWKPNHERLFRHCRYRIVNINGGDYHESLPQAIRRAADIWGWMNSY